MVALSLCRKFPACETFFRTEHVPKQQSPSAQETLIASREANARTLSLFLAPPARKKFTKIAEPRVRAPNRPCSGKSTPFINNLTGLREEGAFRCFRLVFGHELRTRRLLLVSLYKVLLAAAMHEHLPCCPWERAAGAVPRKTTTVGRVLPHERARCRRGPDRRPATGWFHGYRRVPRAGVAGVHVAVTARFLHGRFFLCVPIKGTARGSFPAFSVQDHRKSSNLL